MGKYEIRQAGEVDAAEISAIYAQYVKETAITFEYEPPSPEEFAARIRSAYCDYPYLVCILDGKIIGYAYARRQKERTAYQWNAELSVYINKLHQGAGIGKALYGAIIDILVLQNVINVYGGIALPNEKSEKLHKSAGFTRLGTYHKTGYKLGAWHDVAHYEKAIGDLTLEPRPFQPLSTLNRDAVSTILQRYCDLLNVKSTDV